jgi:16S rRNA A1518/A1519 N6-dimethyltransferase RsmA/KsgA/DIM1 with predicted DNA glycosylase/AP lyase activity
MKIEIIKERILKNGDSVLTFELDEEVKKVIEQRYNKKYSNNLAKLFILDALKNSLLNEIDADFERAKKLNKIKEK